MRLGGLQTFLRLAFRQCLVAVAEPHFEPLVSWWRVFFWKALLAVYGGGVDIYENHLCGDVGTFSRRVVVRSLW